MITTFKGPHAYLSNMFTCENGITYQDIQAPNVETLFQAIKTNNLSQRAWVLASGDAYTAKKRGRKVEMRSDWNSVKVAIMAELVYAKFSQNPQLAQKLLDTGDQTLIEGNTWNDTFWGVNLRTNQGCNYLGNILMYVRNELRKQALS